jgi:GT2 family glycosyltransferase
MITDVGRQPLVINIVLNFNRKDDTLACLSSLAENTYQNQKTIVLDNQSTDGSLEAILSEYPNIQIISLEDNRGYAGNNNAGITVALQQGADWVFILNEDTVLAPNCIEKLISVGENDPDIAILGPMVYHYDEPEFIQTAGGMFDKNLNSWHLAQNELDTGKFLQPHPVDWISGCAIMLRGKPIYEEGMIDERFFYYVEETEWCYRMKKAGWKIIHVPEAKIWHKGVQRDYKPKPSVTYYATRNRLLMLSKHHAPLRAWIATWVYIFRTLLSWSIKPKWRSKREHRNAMWHGVRDFFWHRWGQMPEY